MPLVWSAVEKDSAQTPIDIGVCITKPLPDDDGKFPILGMTGYPLAEKDYGDLVFSREDEEMYEESFLLQILRSDNGYSLSYADREMSDFLEHYDDGEGFRYTGRGGAWEEMKYLLPQMDSLINNAPLDLDDFSEFISLAGLSDDIEPRLTIPREGRAVKDAMLDLLELEYYVKILHAIPLKDE